jgi:hypothetical protein
MRPWPVCLFIEVRQYRNVPCPERRHELTSLRSSCCWVIFFVVDDFVCPIWLYSPTESSPFSNDCAVKWWPERFDPDESQLFRRKRSDLWMPSRSTLENWNQEVRLWVTGPLTNERLSWFISARLPFRVWFPYRSWSCPESPHNTLSSWLFQASKSDTLSEAHRESGVHGNLHCPW